MTLSSTSTVAEIYASYRDSASYMELSDLAKAKAFVTACIILVELKPRSTTFQGTEVVLDIESIIVQQKIAQGWISTNPGTGGGSRVTHVDFGSFRS
jgi:hypothetical protein